jgi:rubrerythrin
MEVFDFALKMEKDGEDFYRNLAREAGDNGVARVLTMLAGAEVKHYEAIKAMANEKYEYSEQPVMAPARNIFQEMKESGEKVFDLKAKQLDAYRTAQELEKKSRDYYRLQAEQMKESPAGEIFSLLANEEEKHYRLLDSLADFVSRPETWLENAEFTKLEDY